MDPTCLAFGFPVNSFVGKCWLVSRQDMLIVLGGLAIAVLGGLAYYYRYHQRVELSDNLGPSLG